MKTLDLGSAAYYNMGRPAEKADIWQLVHRAVATCKAAHYAASCFIGVSSYHIPCHSAAVNIMEVLYMIELDVDK